MREEDASYRRTLARGRAGHLFHHIASNGPKEERSLKSLGTQSYKDLVLVYHAGIYSVRQQ